MRQRHPLFLWILAAFTCSLASPTANGYPMSPVPLWELVERSQTIVLADVVEVREGKAHDQDEPPWNSAIAQLKVRQTWKGEHVDQIEVPFPANLVCPAPPRYVT